MQMFSPSDEAIGGQCLGTGKESEKMLQDVNKPSQGNLERAKGSGREKMPTQEDDYAGIDDCGLGASDNILDEDLSLCEGVENRRWWKPGGLNWWQGKLMPSVLQCSIGVFTRPDGEDRSSKQVSGIS